MSPPFLASSARDPNSHTATCAPKTALAASLIIFASDCAILMAFHPVAGNGCRRRGRQTACLRVSTQIPDQHIRHFTSPSISTVKPVGHTVFSCYFSSHLYLILLLRFS